MSQVVATYRSVEASFTSFEASSRRENVAVKIGADQKSSNLLNNQQRQIIDDVGISQEALQKLEDAQILAKQLQDYLDYLNNGESEGLVKIVRPNQQPSAVVSGRSTELSASVTVATYKEETLEVTADFDDEGNLTALSIDKTTISAEYVRAELTLEDRQFYGVIS